MLAGSRLPVDEVLPRLRSALVDGHAVLSAPPGSGKTTHVPLALLEEPWLNGRRILVMEPRRPAARMAAARMAHLLGEPVGGTMGYQVRFERRIGAHTRVEVLTEGILTRRIQGDPELDGVGLLIFDEFHERSIQADLGLALALDAVDSLRPDLRILIMSATLDTPAVSALLGGAPVIQGEGRAHPVEVLYAGRRPVADPATAVADGVRLALSEQDGDLLAFLPGTGEIRRCAEILEATVGDRAEILPLHGGLTADEQDRALLPNRGPLRRVVLTTDIAETSVTVEGVSTVVDGGLTRKPRFNPGSGLTRLVTEPVSRASSHQRTGRAGRLGPGACYRLWTRDQEVGRPDHRPAEILQADLSPLVLDLALWGVRDPTELAWLDPPPTCHWSQAVTLLQRLGALDARSSITAFGRRMAELPVHPRLARMLIGALGKDARRLAADLAALLSDRDPWLAIPGAPRPTDLTLRLQALISHRASDQPVAVDRRRLATTDRLSRQLLRIAGRAQGKEGLGPGALLALAYPDRVAKRRSGADGRYLLSGGSGAALPPGDPLMVQELLVIADLDLRQREGRIRLALPVSETELRDLFSDDLELVDAVRWDAAREQVSARREERIGALLLSSNPQPLTDSGPTLELLTGEIRRRFEQALSWTPEARQLQARTALLRREEPGCGWPDLSDDWLQANLRDWISPWLAGKRGLAEVRALDLRTVLSSLMDWEHRTRLDAQAPESLITPAGNRRWLDYTAGPEPILAVPLQEMLGASETPAVCSGRVRVTLHLLSPAHRPLQVTRDLAGFWDGSYTAVRKEMRGRYPKHHWPADPANAHPMAHGVKRRSNARIG